MQFAYPWIAWLALPITAALAGFFWWAWRTKRRLMTQFVHARLLANLTASVSLRRQTTRMAMLVGSVFLLLIALAGPRWGYDWEEAHQRGLDIVVAIDVSRSMLADDLAPNRLTRAKLAALDLKKLAHADRMALVAFAGTAFLQCPLTYDDEVFRQSVNELKVNIIPQGGTAISEAITAALGAFREKTDNYKILVMFTDGEDHDSGALDTARDAGKESLRVFTIGVGTPNGELLRTVDEKGRVEFIKDEEGHAVKSRLNESLLQEIAKVTGGFYQRLAGANTIDTLYQRGLAPLPKTEFASQRIRRWHERYQWFLGVAMVLLVAEMFVPERRSQRSARTLAEQREPAPAAAARVAVMLLVALMIATPAAASPDSALKKYSKGRYDSALSEYERLLDKKQTDPTLSFNAGTAAYQAGDYGKAAEHLQSAVLAPDLKLQQSAWYNMGNTQFRLGEDAKELEDKERLWTQSTNSFDSALKLNPQDADARANLKFVQHKLEELEKQKQQQQQQQNKDSDKHDNKDQQNKDNQQQQQNQKQDQKDQQQQNQNQKNNQAKSEEQKKQEQEQQKQREQEQKKADEQKAQQQQQAGKKPDQKPEPAGNPENQNARPGQQVEVRMTPQQAKQLLDTQKDDEHMMIFLPESKTNRANRVFNPKT